MTTAISKDIGQKALNSKKGNQNNRSHSTNPVKVAHEKEKASLDAEVQAITAKIEAIRIKIEETKAAKSAGPKDERTKLSDDMKEHKSKVSQLMREKEVLISTRDSNLETVRRKADSHKASIEKLPFQSLSAYDKKISELDSMIQSGSLALIEEKKAVAEISKLARSRKTLESLLASGAGSTDMEYQSIESLKAAIREKEDSIRALKKEMNAIYNKMESLKDSKDSSRAIVAGLVEERKKLQAQKQLVEEKRVAAMAKYKVDIEKYFENRNKEILAKKIQNKRFNLEKAVERAEKDVLDVELPSFSDEISAVQYLINTLLSLKAPIAKNESSTSAAATTTKEQEKSSSEVILKKKSDREEEIFFKAAKPSAKGQQSVGVPKKSRDVPSNATLKLPMQVIVGLGQFSVPVPSNSSEIDGVVESLKERKVSFEHKQKEAASKIDEIREAAKAKVQTAKDALAAFEADPEASVKAEETLERKPRKEVNEEEEPTN